jgi:hypothetical protein
MARTTKQAPKTAKAPAVDPKYVFHIRTRRARSSGVMVEFRRAGEHLYECECEHGTVVQGTKRYATARKAAAPEGWCDACKTIAQERAKAQAAKAAKPEQKGRKAPAKKAATKRTTAKARKAA